MITACWIAGGVVAGVVLFAGISYVVLVYGPDTNISF